MILLSGETKDVETIDVGSAVGANRSITSSTFFTDGNSEYEGRTYVPVYPCLNYIGQRDNDIRPIAVRNTSSINKTVGKGTKIGQCYTYIIEFKDDDVDKINVLDAADFSVE